MSDAGLYSVANVESSEEMKTLIKNLKGDASYFLCHRSRAGPKVLKMRITASIYLALGAGACKRIVILDHYRPDNPVGFMQYWLPC
jgi:hypothetical protein